MSKAVSPSAASPKTLPGLDALVTELFDFAGMYPPASLSFEATLTERATFAEVATRPFICNADFVVDIPHLSKLLDLADKGSLPRIRRDKRALKDASVDRIRVAVLGKALAPPLTRESLPEVIAQDLVVLRRSHETTSRSPSVSVTSYEVRLDPLLTKDPHLLSAICHELLLILPDEATSLALEPVLSGPDWESTLEVAAQVLGQLLERAPARVFLKIRGAGSQGSGSTGIDKDRIARVLRRATLMGIALKATAGLHHPIIEAERYQNVLGFLNLRMAGLLLAKFKEQIPTEVVMKLLAESDPQAFSLTDGVGWGAWEISSTEVASISRAYPLTIGSCSLSEPDADLQRLFG